MLSTIEAEALDILFVEDDPDIAEMYRLKLELDGYWVRIVRPDTAVAAARAHCPEILFLDMSAGQPERLGVLRAIREAVHRPNLPSIVLSASGADDLHANGSRLSASDYVIRVPAAERDVKL